MSGYVSGLCYLVRFGCPTTKAVAVALADHAWDDGTHTYPSVKRLSEKCEVSERTVQRCLRRLEAMGVLVVVRSGGRGPSSTREWRFDLHLLRTLGEATDSQLIHKNKGDRMAPLDGELRVTPETPKGDTDDNKGDTRVTRTVTNHQEPYSAPLPPSEIAEAPSGHGLEIGLKGPDSAERARVAKQFDQLAADMRSAHGRHAPNRADRHRRRPAMGNRPEAGMVGPQRAQAGGTPEPGRPGAASVGGTRG